MDWRVLGPLEVWANGSPVSLGGRQRRLVLAILLANAHQAVSTDRVIEEVWGGSPPDSARKTIQAHVAHLRKVLTGDLEVLTPSGEGYTLAPAQGSVDAGRFEAAVNEAQQLSADPLRVVAILDEALAVFRGEPYAGLADDALTVKVEATRLSELRLSAREDRLEALLACGDSPRVATDAERLLADHPLRERLWAIQMLALYRDGRQSDALRSYSRARQILSEELGIEPSRELQALEQRILNQDNTLAYSTQTLAATGPAVEVRRNPYKGLRAFGEVDADDFFGRAELVELLLERITRRPHAPLTVLAGPSGAGKSSVLRAGLIPLLRELGLCVAVMFPGGNPEAALEEALRVAESEGANGEDRRAVDVVAVDQLEELFTQATHERADQFIARVTDDSDATRWIATVRADFLDDLLTHPQLGRRLQEALVLVPPLEDEEVAAAIAEPARHVGVAAEPSLVATVVRDVQARSSSLPLLQYAMTDLFERRRGDLLTRDAYKRAGGLSGALVRRADQVYTRLTGDQRDRARQMFLQLITIAESGEFARRRIHRDSLYSDDRQFVDEILEQFGAQRLLTFDQDTETGAATVEVAHESLLDVWPRLAGWIDEAREDLLMRSALSTARAEWEANNRTPSFLLSGGRLAQHETWTADTDLALTENEVTFLHESRRAVDLARQRRRRLRRWTMAGFGVAAVVSMVFGLFALNNERQAEAAALASASQAALTGDPELAVLLAIQSLGVASTDEGADALGQAIQANRTIYEFSLASGGSEGQVSAMSPDGRHVAHGRLFGGSLDLYSIDAPGTVEATLSADGGMGFVWAAFSEDGSSLLTIEEPMSDDTVYGAVRVFDAATHQELESIEMPSCTAPLASPRGEHIDPTLPIFLSQWEVVDGECVAEPFGGGDLGLITFDLNTSAVSEVAELWNWASNTQGNPTMSANGSRLAYAQGRGGAVIDVVTGEELMTLPPGLSQLSSDGSLVLMGNGPIELWDVGSQEKLREFSGSHNVAHFSSDETLVFAGDVDGSMVIFDAFTGEELLRLRGQGNEVVQLSLTDDQSLLSSASVDGTFRIWDVGSALVGDAGLPSLIADLGEWGGPLDSANHLLLAPEDLDPPTLGKYVSTLFDTRTGTDVATFEGRALAVSGDGARVAIHRWVAPDDSSESRVLGPLEIIDAASGETEVVLEGPCVFRVVHDPLEPEFIPEPDCEPDLEPWLDVPVNMDFSPNGRMLAMTGRAGVTTVWDTSSGAVLWSHEHVERIGFPEGFGGVAFSPDGTLLAAASLNDPDILIFDASTGEQVAAIRHDTFISTLTFTPDGSLLLAGDNLTHVRVIDTETWTAGDPLVGQQGNFMRDLTVSPNSRYVATAGFDGESWVWDLADRRVVRKWATPGQAIVSVEFLDDETLVIAPQGSDAVIVTLDPETQLEYARTVVGRGFRVDECATYKIEPCPSLEEIKAG